MAHRPGQRASTKLDFVCREMTGVVEARTLKPLLVPLSWVRFFALGLAGGGGLRVPFGCVVPYFFLGGVF